MRQRLGLNRDSAAIRLGSWESARAFKGIICVGISEFGSDAKRPQAREWRRRPARSKRNLVVETLQHRGSLRLCGATYAVPGCASVYHTLTTC
jgi:hypothetical protein